jgi:hypothetical protein
LTVRFVQLLILLIPIALFGWLLWLDIDPDGVKEIRYEMGDLSPYVDRLLPEELDIPQSSATREVNMHFSRTTVS